MSADSPISKTAAAHGDYLEPLVSRLCWIHVACNGDQGVFEGKAWRVELHNEKDMILSFECMYFDTAPAISFERGKPGWVRIAGIKIDAIGPVEHVGNWCWNAWRVRRRDVAAMLVNPRFLKWFCDPEGWCDAANAWAAACPANNSAEAQ